MKNFIKFNREVLFTRMKTFEKVCWVIYLIQLALGITFAVIIWRDDIKRILSKPFKRLKLGKRYIKAERREDDDWKFFDEDDVKIGFQYKGDES